MVVLGVAFKGEKEEENSRHNGSKKAKKKEALSKNKTRENSVHKPFHPMLKISHSLSYEDLKGDLKNCLNLENSIWLNLSYDCHIMTISLEAVKKGG